MAKQNNVGGSKQTNKIKTVKKPETQQSARKESAAKSMPKPAAKPVAKPTAKTEPSFAKPRHQVVRPEDAGAKPFLSSPLGIAILAAGAIMFFAGIFMLGKIQYAGVGRERFAMGCALMAFGVIVPCVGVKQFRNYLFPRKTIDQYDLARNDVKKN